MNTTKRLLCSSLAATLAFTTLAQSAQAALIGTEQFVEAQRQAAGVSTLEGELARSRALAALQREDVVAALAERGVDVEQARLRVASLTDEEAQRLAATLDHGPAGGDVLGVALFVFVLLLITDILGFTRIFPFTRSIR